MGMVVYHLRSKWTFQVSNIDDQYWVARNTEFSRGVSATRLEQKQTETSTAQGHVQARSSRAQASDKNPCLPRDYCRDYAASLQAGG
ncbi:uncharacterized protein VTP21DRAFT_11387 [Calcarisporiella thermophila]|uniref:uncharacterized protein n=1 Tax=Calcarisporiella thermophila TaxID=911321 RepID=UPI003743AD72